MGKAKTATKELEQTGETAPEVSSGNEAGNGTSAPVGTEIGQVRSAVTTDVASDEEYAKFMQQIEQANQENIGVGEIQISRISVVQGITKEIGQRVAGYEPGQFFDNMSREVISEFDKAPWMRGKVNDENRIPAFHFLTIVPIMRLPSEYVKWPTKEERGGGMTMFHWKELDVHHPNVRAGLWAPKGIWKPKEKGEAPPVTEHLNILCYCLNQDGNKRTGLMINSYAKTSFRTGQRLVSSCVQQRASGLPFWGRIKWIYSEPKSEGGNTWSVIRFANGPKLLEFGSEGPEPMKQLFRECFEEARRLSDTTPSEFDPEKTTGRYLQELYINAAQFDVEAETADTGTFNDDGGADTTAETSNPTF